MSKPIIEIIEDIPKEDWDWLINTQKVCEKLGITEKQVFKDYKEIFDKDGRIQQITDINNKSRMTVNLLKTKYSNELRSGISKKPLIDIKNIEINKNNLIDNVIMKASWIENGLIKTGAIPNKNYTITDLFKLAIEADRNWTIECGLNNIDKSIESI
jgi:hypothetical protein